MFYRTVFLLSLMTTGLVAQSGDRSEIDLSSPPPEWEIPEAPVLSPEEALESFKLPPGFRIEVVASEPLIQDPVAMDIDADGRIWVVEMRSYMPNIDGEGEIVPTSRVVVLEDTDGDGRMDKSTTWMDGLTLPRSIRVVEGGVLIGEPPHLWFTRDTDGDGRADEKVSIYDQYSRRDANPEHGANGLLIGIDNWIHNSMFDGGRFRYIDGEWVRKPALMRGQWGISHDDYGRHFTNSNSDYLRADLVPNHYYTRNPNFPARGGIIPGTMGGVYERLDSRQTVWPARITPGVNRRAQLDDDGYLTRFTAACSPLVYRGDQFPAEYQGNVFVAEPAAHFIRRSIITEDEQGILSGTNAYEDDEFLHSSDERFRPVNLYNAPDGSLYVLDFYRGVIQHRQFVTTYLRKQVEERELEEPLGLGRIYRVVHESAEERPAPRMSEESPAELIKYLEDPNGWWRDTAQQQLIERRDQSVVPALRKLAQEASDDRAQIHALWTLEGLQALDEEIALTAMKDESPSVRSTGARLAELMLEENENPVLTEALIDLLKDDQAPVRLQATLSLGFSQSQRKETAFLELVEKHSDQPYIAEAVLSGLPGRELEFLEELVTNADWKTEDQKDAGEIISAFAASVMREGEPERINRVIELALTDSTPWKQMAVLDGIAGSRVVRLQERPSALSQTASDAAVAQRAEAVFAKLEWPEPTDVQEEELTEEMLSLIATGQEQYLIHCAACHQTSGQGMPGLSKPLVGSRWVVGKEENMIRILLNGKEGEDMVMPSMSWMEDEQIAAILSFIRTSWGNDSAPITPETVTRVRENNTRTTVWTDADLEKIQ